MPVVTQKLQFRQRFIILLGSLGPLGYLPASGTVTVAVVGIPLFRLVHSWPPAVYAVVTCGFIALSVWMHQVGDRILAEKDSRKLVWDELSGFLVAVAFVPFTWQLALLSLVVERVLDVVKIPPARRIERTWPGGWGVVGDDVVAGVYTCAVLHTLTRLAPTWLGVGPVAG